MKPTITDSNFIGVAMHYYDNVQCNTVEEFEDDLSKIICIKKLSEKYLSSGKINLRLILNHIIILHNSFGDIMVDMIKFKINEEFLSPLKSIFRYLGYLDENDWDDIEEDTNMYDKL